MKCSACGLVEVLASADPCMACVRARHRAALTHRCACNKSCKRPREVVLFNRIEVRCDRCLGNISTKERPRV